MPASKPRPRLIRLISALRWYAVNMAAWLRGSGGAGTEVKVAHLDVRRNLWHRYLHILILFLQLNGYRVELRHRWRFVADWASSDLFRRLRGLRLVLRPPARGADLIITDRAGTPGTLVLDADYFSLPDEAPTGYRAPMPMADTAYLLGVHERSIDLSAERQRAIFFFGNMDRHAYARPEVPTLFGCMDRTHLLDAVRRARPHRVHEPTGEGGIGITDGRDIVLVDRARHYIAPKDLPAVLARFDFFLAPAGVIMPLCHNLVEALFAGCIPILQHAHLLDPPLQDGVHCLSFRDEEGLIAALDRARAMSAEQAACMRASARAYYDAYLSPQAVVRRLEQQREGRLRLNAESASVRILERKLRASSGSGWHAATA